MRRSEDERITRWKETIDIGAETGNRIEEEDTIMRKIWNCMLRGSKKRINENCVQKEEKNRFGWILLTEKRGRWEFGWGRVCLLDRLGIQKKSNCNWKGKGEERDERRWETKKESKKINVKIDRTIEKKRRNWMETEEEQEEKGMKGEEDRNRS